MLLGLRNQAADPKAFEDDRGKLSARSSAKVSSVPNASNEFGSWARAAAETTDVARGGPGRRC